MTSYLILKNNDDLPVNVNNLLAPPTPPLKLKIRNTTKYLNWHLSILKRDNFTCKICHTSVKDNKSLRLEVRHAKTFDDLCNENNVSTLCAELILVSPDTPLFSYFLRTL